MLSFQNEYLVFQSLITLYKHKLGKFPSFVCSSFFFTQNVHTKLEFSNMVLMSYMSKLQHMYIDVIYEQTAEHVHKPKHQKSQLTLITNKHKCGESKIKENAFINIHVV